MVIWIIGHAGTGKTTLAANLAGIVPAVDMDMLASRLNNGWVISPELLTLSLMQGFRVFCGTCDNKQEIMNVFAKYGERVMFFNMLSEDRNDVLVKRIEWAGKRNPDLKREDMIEKTFVDIAKRDRLPYYIVEPMKLYDESSEDSLPGRRRIPREASVINFPFPRELKIGWTPDPNTELDFVTQTVFDFVKRNFGLMSKYVTHPSTSGSKWKQIPGFQEMFDKLLPAAKSQDEVFNIRKVEEETFQRFGQKPPRTGEKTNGSK